MKINSAIRALFGLTTALGAAAVAPPAGAATVTVNDATGVATGAGELIKPDSNGVIPFQCLLTLDLALASGVSAGTAYTVPPALVLGDVTSVNFQPGTSYCSSFSATGLPWSIEVTSVTSSTTANVKIDGFFSMYWPTFGYCTSTSVSGTVVEESDGTEIIKIPPFVLASTTPVGTANGNCSSVGTITLTISAAAAPYFSLTYP